MRLLDLFCGAGGAAAGYRAAGFDTIVGVDRAAQDRYPFAFVLGDALEYLSEFGDTYDAIHASPPCQLYSSISRVSAKANRHPDLVGPVRELLVRSGAKWVIENVAGAPLINPTTLCGSMFGLQLRRHRLFETNFPLEEPPPCNHGGQIYGVYGHTGGRMNSARLQASGRKCPPRGSVADWKRAMGIDWMLCRELSQAIPPAFTQWIGRQLLVALGSKI